MGAIVPGGLSLPCQVRPRRRRRPAILGRPPDPQPEEFIVTESAGRRFDDATEALRHGLRTGERQYPFVLLDGAPLSGVTRSMYEAVRRHPDALLIHTWTALDVAAAVNSPAALTDFDERLDPTQPSLIWLDDLSPADLLLLTPGVLDAVSHRALIIASINTSWVDRILADRSPVTANGRVVLLEYAARVTVSFELEHHVRKQLSAQRPDLDFSTSVGEAFVGGNVLLQRYKSAGAAAADGRMLVEAASDARRAGLHRGVRETELKNLLPRSSVAPRGQRRFASALEWATLAPAGASSGILFSGKEKDTWQVMSYVAAADDGSRGNPTRPIYDQTWDAIITTVPAADALQVGVSAHLRGRADVAEKAFRRAAGADHPVVAARAAAFLT
ncbi:hypothetical protein [Amycolatopsis sp. RTGN1]|uniref:hypothetical protein n=1 Tax=Amycolatopsis ponsaeliensis TaxID=2992142 RepID=UPI00254D8308|nr:hypothetical protein [Amycolatopsis sp. RTGN1]